jgi:hypothetical protein
MYVIHDDGSETFGIPWHRMVLPWIFEALFLAMTVVGLAMMWHDFWLGTAPVLLFGALAAFIAPALRLLPGKIRTDAHAITYEPARGEPLALPWNQVARIVERPFLQRLELHGTGGAAVIPVENHIDHFGRLWSLLLERTDWENTGTPPDLPSTFYRVRMYFIGAAIGSALFLSLGAFFLSRGDFFGLFVIALGLGSVLDWYAVTVDRSAVTLHYPFRTRTIPVDQIEQIWLGGSLPTVGSATITVSLHMPGGKTRKLSTVEGGIFELYRTILAAREGPA